MRLLIFILAVIAVCGAFYGIMAVDDHFRDMERRRIEEFFKGAECERTDDDNMVRGNGSYRICIHKKNSLRKGFNHDRSHKGD